jgi:hypothetical protein
MTDPAQRTWLTGHELLLRMAGRVPDQALAQARRMLADGQAGTAITIVADLIAAAPIQLTAGELAAIRDLIGNAQALSGTEPVAGPVPSRFAFSELDTSGEVERDEIDEALVAAAEEHGTGVAAIWRTWRYSVPGDSAAHRVYIVQVDDPAMIQGLAADLLDAVPGATAGVEIITSDEEPPPYQQAALAQSRLVWASSDEPEFTVARIYDFAKPDTGPGFAPDHPVIEDAVERDQILGYLRGGYPALLTTATIGDILDPAAGSVVPTGVRTDGEWIWADTVTYYLDRYRLAPDTELTAHIRSQIAAGQTTPDTDRETAIAAANFMLHPPSEHRRTAVWFPAAG